MQIKNLLLVSLPRFEDNPRKQTMVHGHQSEQDMLVQGLRGNPGNGDAQKCHTLRNIEVDDPRV
jgi:hypothetical protein